MVNVEALQSVVPQHGGQPGARRFFTDGSQIEVDENVTEIEALL
jgi:hypothetical protein